jgi:hypothetical protein
MTDQPLLPPAENPPERVAVEPKIPPRDLVPWFYALGFLVLAFAVFYLWQYPSMPGEAADANPAIHAIEQRLSDIDARVTRLEQRPTADWEKIATRVDALDGRVANQTQLASRLDALSGRIESLSSRDQVSLDSTKQQLDSLVSQVATVQASSGNLDAIVKRLNRIARIQAASLALAAGRPLGDLRDAPEPLAHFAHTAPPTEAQLRLRFQRDEQAALAARQPDDSNRPFIGRVWERAQGLITIRRGDDIVVGNPSAAALTRAQAALDTGDLTGAVSAVEVLKGQPEQAMANWLADAKALLNARSALANMADQA